MRARGDAAHDPAILTHVSKAHDGHAGVYAAVLAEGVFRPGDTVELLDWATGGPMPPALQGADSRIPDLRTP